jgi:hypothetical protein
MAAIGKKIGGRMVATKEKARTKARNVLLPHFPPVKK